MADEIQQSGPGDRAPTSANPPGLGERYDIQYAAPLRDYDSPRARAFVARPRGPGDAGFALATDPTLPPRLKMIEELARSPRLPGLVTPIDFGVIGWPPAGRRIFAVVVTQPAGGPVQPRGERPMAPWTEEQVIHGLFTPVAATLAVLAERHMTHRNIRLGNLYYQVGARRLVMLGECVTAPPGLYQPGAYETLGSAMADPVARGNGTLANDLFSLGAVAIALLGGRAPGGSLTDSELIDARIARGSWAALAAGLRPSTAMEEILRGLVYDEPAGRTTLPDLNQWIAGRRRGARETVIRAPVRETEFLGRQIASPRDLAHMLVRMGERAGTLVKDKTVESWVLRAFADRELATSLTSAYESRGDGPPSSSARDAWLTARMVIALDPDGPIRYAGRAALPDGLGYALAVGVAEGSLTRTYAEILTGRLPSYWLTRQAHPDPDQQTLVFGYERLRRVIEDSHPGYGIERAAYDLVPGLHCLSALVEPLYLTGPVGLLAALDAAVREKRADGLPIDRSIAAFLGHHLVDLDPGVIGRLDDPMATERALALTRLYAAVQRLDPVPVPALAQRLAEGVMPLVDGLHDRSLREMVKLKIGEAVAAGHLREIVALIDNGRLRKLDQDRFRRAQIEHKFARKRLAVIDHDAETAIDDGVALADLLAVRLADTVFLIALGATFLMLEGG